jgi:hypothetical protein
MFRTLEPLNVELVNLSAVKYRGFLTGLPFGIALSDHWKRNLLITLLLFGAYLAIVTGAARTFFH